MAISKPLSFKFLLTTLLCGTLAGCGRGDGASHAVYNGESVASRTATVSAATSGHIHARLSRLENDVSVLKNDVSQLAMTYNGLMTTNERIDKLLTNLENEKPAATAAVVEKAPAAPTAKAVKPAPKPESKPGARLPKKATVVGVRLGEHGHKSRLVIDASKLDAVTVDLDNAERILLVTLPKMRWTAKETVSGLSSPLVAGWTVQDTAGGKTMAVQLKKPVKILTREKIAADKGAPARYVIDLGAAS